MKNPSKAYIFLLLFLPALMQGQEIGLLRINPERPDFQGHAALWGGVEQGWFRPTYDATLQWSAGARARGIRHGERTSWTGSVSFVQKTGYGMLSSMFLEPGYFPVDLMEFSPGTKSRETGRLEAGFLTDLGYEWAAGAKASFQAAYGGKRTDLRHSAFGMDLQLEPTVTYVMDDNMGFATAYVFRLKTERLRMKQPGDAVFLDKGLRYGSFLNTDAADVFPVREMSHGFSELFYSEELSAGVTWLWKRGQADAAGIGRFRFPGSTVSVFFEQTVQADKADHFYRLSYQRGRDQLREGSTETAGLSSASDRVVRSLEAKYETRFLHGAVKRLGITLEAQRREERSMTPFWDQTKRNLGTATLSAAFSLGAFDLDLDVLAGGGVWRDKGRSRSEDTDMPYRRTEDWLRLMDYTVAPRIGTGGTLVYRLPSVKGLYLQVDGRWYHALRKTATGGQNRGIANFTVGYNF